MQVKISNIVKLYTVLLLRESPKHGYELMKELEERLDMKISPGQMYPFLSILEDNGHIKIERIGERDKKIYVMTPKGKKFVDGFLQRFGNLLQVAIESKISICAHCGCKVYEGGYKERIGGKIMAFCCHYCAASFRKNKG